jgi:hypothetical protein
MIGDALVALEVDAKQQQRGARTHSDAIAIAREHLQQVADIGEPTHELELECDTPPRPWQTLVGTPGPPAGGDANTVCGFWVASYFPYSGGFAPR